MSTTDPRSALHGVDSITTPDDAARALSGYSTAGWAGLSPEARNAWRDAAAHAQETGKRADPDRMGQLSPEEVAEHTIRHTYRETLPARERANIREAIIAAVTFDRTLSR